MQNWRAKPSPRHAHDGRLVLSLSGKIAETPCIKYAQRQGSTSAPLHSFYIRFYAQR